jgi:hypothetical protein
MQAQFGEHAYQFRTVQFRITEERLGHQDVHDKIRTAIPPLDDLGAKILVILDKSPFESARSIVLLPLYDSIDFKSFHLH